MLGYLSTKDDGILSIGLRSMPSSKSLHLYNFMLIFIPKIMKRFTSFFSMLHASWLIKLMYLALYWGINEFRNSLTAEDTFRIATIVEIIWLDLFDESPSAIKWWAGIPYFIKGEKTPSKKRSADRFSPNTFITNSFSLIMPVNRKSLSESKID